MVGVKDRTSSHCLKCIILVLRKTNTVYQERLNNCRTRYKTEHGQGVIIVLVKINWRPYSYQVG